jgi:hypothetical protein
MRDDLVAISSPNKQKKIKKMLSLRNLVAIRSLSECKNKKNDLSLGDLVATRLFDVDFEG